MRAPMNPSNPLRFFVLRVPFFLEPNYERNENWHETNRNRLECKWGGKEAFAAQKRRHRLKERGQEVGIEHFNLDRLASNTLASHRLVQWITKLYGCIASEAVYNVLNLSLIHISEPTRRRGISYAVFCLKKKGIRFRRTQKVYIAI